MGEHADREVPIPQQYSSSSENQNLHIMQRITDFASTQALQENMSSTYMTQTPPKTFKTEDIGTDLSSDDVETRIKTETKDQLQSHHSSPLAGKEMNNAFQCYSDSPNQMPGKVQSKEDSLIHSVTKSKSISKDKKSLAKEPPAIKRPLNSFMLYRRDRSKELPTNNHQSISRIIGQLWQKESPEVKKYYSDLAAEEAVKHAIAHPDYRYRPRRHSNTRRKKQNAVAKASAFGMTSSASIASSNGSVNSSQTLVQSLCSPDSNSMATNMKMQQKQFCHSMVPSRTMTPGVLPSHHFYRLQAESMLPRRSASVCHELVNPYQRGPVGWTSSPENDTWRRMSTSALSGNFSAVAQHYGAHDSFQPIHNSHLANDASSSCCSEIYNESDSYIEPNVLQESSLTTSDDSSYPSSLPPPPPIFDSALGINGLTKEFQSVPPFPSPTSFIDMSTPNAHEHFESLTDFWNRWLVPEESF